AARRPGAGDFVDRTVERLASVVTVRRVDAPPAGTVDAAVATAERALASGDAAGALAALAPIRGAVAAAAPDWLAAAEARRDADAALEALTRRVAAIVGGGR
ncbi:MAG: uroporphyrinogen-III synthase, partial [Alphaproteobacteria bacterium]